ncbi:MAG: Pycsar system effector family protein [Bacteroidota bacterium]
MVQAKRSPIISDTEDYIEKHFREQVSSDYVYHNMQHVQNVVEATRRIAQYYPLTEEELEILEIAAWFHDSGFHEGSEGHEERSVALAETFLSAKDYATERIARIQAAILDTKHGAQPESLINQILRDADLSHLGSVAYWENCGKVRQELAITQGRIMSEKEWIDFELAFMEQQAYITDVAKDLYQERKEKHIRQLKKQRLRLYPNELLEQEQSNKKRKKKKKKKAQKSRRESDQEQYEEDAELKELKLGRGVETMYRSTYRTHINLSSIADNKANIMLSINAIIISIVVASLVPKLVDFTFFLVPTVMLLLVCLISIVFATLSTRPKVTEGKFTMSDIQNKTSNLLFFGNYYNMDLETFHWGMTEMIKDSDFLYSSMTRDLYFLGKVLAEKYRYLSICYNLFMYGLILVVIAFFIAFAVGSNAA